MALQNYTISDLKNLAEILAKNDLLEPTKITKKLDISKIINTIKGTK